MFEIEKVDMEHIDRIRPLWEKLTQANASHSPYFADYYGTFEFEVRKGFLQEKLNGGAAMYTAVLVDRDKKQDAGFVTVTYNRDTSFGEIEMLFLLEEYRGQGMGKKLFKMALSCLDINCIRDRKLCLTYGNEAALRLYQSLGSTRSPSTVCRRTESAFPVQVLKNETAAAFRGNSGCSGCFFIKSCIYTL